MGYRCNFLDNQIYSAGDVNDVFACLTSGGVIFCDTGNTLTDLNAAVASAVGSGVISDADSCKVVNDEGVYKISSGACFMHDGSLIIFDEDGEEITVPEGSKSYVFIKRNVAENSIEVMVSPISGGNESVPLAEITENGTILDRRRYAVSKVMLGSGNTIKNFSIEFNDCSNVSSETVTIDLGSGNFSYIVVRGGTCFLTGGTTEQRVPSGKNLNTLEEGNTVNLLVGRIESKPLEYVYAKKNGQYLEVKLGSTASIARYTLDISVI